MSRLSSSLAIMALYAALGGPSVLAMGPDPGGHTGAKVTPQTTKTDRPHVDQKREQTSGSRTETNAPDAGSASRKD